MCMGLWAVASTYFDSEREVLFESRVAITESESRGSLGTEVTVAFIFSL